MKKGLQLAAQTQRNIADILGIGSGDIRYKRSSGPLGCYLIIMGHIMNP
jgi:hypothetical protein